MTRHQVTLIPGDWVGPETCEAVKTVIAAAGVEIDWDEQHCPNGHITEELLKSCKKNKVVLKARIGAQAEVGQHPATVELRKALELWATVRPVKALSGVGAKFPDIDVVVVRETSEDIYSGFEHQVSEGVFEAVKVTTEAACRRIARYGFDYARAHGRKKLTIVHKANIMKKSDGMFLRIAKEVAKDYPDIEVNETIVDALCMWLVKAPHYYDVLLTLNLFGDIVSDLCSGLAGGITASPSVSYNPESGLALFENLHGKAPELVGKNKANPIPMLNASVMMLEHLGEKAAAERIQIAIVAAVTQGIRTVDMGGSHSCSDFVRVITEQL